MVSRASKSADRTVEIRRSFRKDSWGDWRGRDSAGLIYILLN
jgi:hypothetical protein